MIEISQPFDRICQTQENSLGASYSEWNVLRNTIHHIRYIALAAKWYKDQFCGIQASHQAWSTVSQMRNLHDALDFDKESTD